MPRRGSYKPSAEPVVMTSKARICLSTGAVSPGDDHLVQHFLHYAADMEEMGAWLRDESNADAIIDSLKQLSARVDKGFD